MAHVVVYSTKVCPYCDRAKALLKRKGAVFSEIDLSDDAAGREALILKAGGRKTVPQIFIDNKHIGGCDDLYALDAKGMLDPLLA